jgi:hypothetical protein
VHDAEREVVLLAGGPRVDDSRVTGVVARRDSHPEDARVSSVEKNQYQYTHRYH